MNTYLSRKICFFHIFGVLLVLPIHAYFPCTESFSVFRNVFVLICRSFQPIYFGLAGYLYFVNFNVSGGGYKQKNIKRFRSLVIPYILWNIYVAILMFVLIKSDIESSIVIKAAPYYEQFDLLKFLLYVFWKPAAGQLWFIRDLILLSICSLPIYYMLRNKKIYVLIIFAILALLIPKPQFASLFSFAVGGYICINNVKIENITPKVYITAFVVFAFMMVTFTINPHESNAIPLLSWSTALLLWGLYDFIMKKYHNVIDLSPWRSMFFFVYLAHDPLLHILCSYGSYYLKQNFISNMVVFVLSQILIILICCIADRILKKRCYKFYSIITGSR